MKDYWVSTCLRSPEATNISEWVWGNCQLARGLVPVIGNERTIKILENFSKQVMGEDGKRECRTEILQKTCPGGFSCSKRSEGFPNLSVLSVQCSDFQMWVRGWVTSELLIVLVKNTVFWDWIKISEFHGMGLVSCSIPESFKAC